MLSVDGCAHGARMQNKTALLITLMLAACTVPNELASSTTSQPVVSLGEPTWIAMPAGNTNDYVLSTDTRQNNYTFTPNASGSTLTGIDASLVIGGDGVWIRNGSATVPLILGHNNAGSDPYNRFALPYGQDFALAPGRSVFVAFITHDGALVGWQIFLEPGMYVTAMNSSPGHSFDNVWQNTTGRPVLGLYSVKVQTSLTLTTGSAGHVELAMGAGAGAQLTICGRVGAASAGSLAVTLSETPVTEGQLTCMIPPGWFVILRRVNEVNTPTYTITNQFEQAL